MLWEFQFFGPKTLSPQWSGSRFCKTGSSHENGRNIRTMRRNAEELAIV